MFFCIIIVLLILFHNRGHEIPVDELWFMMSIFVGLAYVGGFLDSRIFAAFDKRNASRLEDAERRYEENIETESPLP